METIKAFILTGDWEDRRGKNNLRFFCCSNQHGPIEIIIDNFRPVFFVYKNSDISFINVPFRKKEVKFFTFDNNPVDAIYFNKQRDLRTAADNLHSKSITTFESDVDPVRRFLMEKGINAQIEISGIPEKRDGFLSFRNPKVKPVEFQPQFTTASIDIETSTRGRKKLYSIAAHITGNKGELKKIFMIGKPDENSAEYIQYFSTETELLTSFSRWFNNVDPDIIIGWHVIGFDLLFLFEKARELNLNLRLARGESEGIIKPRKFGGYFAKFPGRIIIDGPQSLRMSFFSFEDFKLETVAQEMLGIGKKIDTDKNKIDEIERMFEHDKSALAEYNLQDAVLVTDIFKKSKLIELSVKRSQLSGLQMDQLGMMSAAFDHFFLPKLHKAKFVAPNVADLKFTEHSAGGYVMNPKPGLYNDVIVLDFKSLYPTIIETFKIDPLSRLLSHVDPIETPGHYKFSSTQNFLPDFITKLMEQRAEAVRNNDKPLSQAIKILMNSFYGVMGSYGCRFYHPHLPSGITSTGQWLLLESRKFLEEKGYEVLYGDTDSLFVKLNEINEKDNEGKILAKKLNIYWKERIPKEFKTKSYLEIKFEKYYRKFLIAYARGGGDTGAKKRYAGLTIKNGNEALEFVGMEFVRSDWTKLAKEFQEELFRRIFKEEELHNWIRNLVKEINEGLHDKKLVYKKRLRKDVDDYVKNVPPQVKAARMLSGNGSVVYYIITKKGPVPVELNPRDIDYQHYIDKQIKPLADSVLGLLGEKFDNIVNPHQLDMFDEE